jgi:hypothetical protein
MDGQNSVGHPVWCTRREPDGVHTSRVWEANFGGEAVRVSAYLSQYEHSRKDAAIVLVFGEEKYLLEVSQAQALLHILRRLTRMA